MESNFNPSEGLIFLYVLLYLYSVQVTAETDVMMMNKKYRIVTSCSVLSNKAYCI